MPVPIHHVVAREKRRIILRALDSELLRVAVSLLAHTDSKASDRSRLFIQDVNSRNQTRLSYAQRTWIESIIFANDPLFWSILEKEKLG